MTDERFSVTCPNCNARYVYQTASVNTEGQVSCQNCGRLIGAVGQTVTAAPQVSQLESYIPYKERSDETGVVIVKLYGHGFVFSLLTILISFIYMFLSFFFIAFGGFIGLIISIVFLAAMLGGVNVGLASAIWEINSRSNLQSVLAQGGVIFMFIMVVGLILLPLVFLPFEFLLILDFVFFPFIYGLVFRAIALAFEISKVDDAGTVSSAYRSAKCPKCGARYAYHLSSRDEDGNVICQNCAEVFSLQVGPELM